MTEQEQSLLDYFRQLAQADQHTLLRFAEFLVAGEVTEAASQAANTAAVSAKETNGSVTAPQDSIEKPIEIEKPQDERVVDALKRMTATYPMLDKKPMLDKASGLVMQHVMLGKPAVVVIKEIEDMFSKAYDEYVEAKRRG